MCKGSIRLKPVPKYCRAQGPALLLHSRYTVSLATSHLQVRKGPSCLTASLFGCHTRHEITIASRVLPVAPQGCFSITSYVHTSYFFYPNHMSCQLWLSQYVHWLISQSMWAWSLSSNITTRSSQLTARSAHLGRQIFWIGVLKCAERIYLLRAMLINCRLL